MSRNKRSRSLVPGSRRVAALALALASLPAAARAEKVSLDLNIDPDDNQLPLTISASVAVGTRSDYRFPTVSGNVLADLDLSFDPTTHAVSSVSALELTGGIFSVSNTTFLLDWGFFVGSIELTGKSIRGTFSTPNPPAAVTGNTFNAADHQITLDSGLLNAEGTGLVGAFLPRNPYVIKLWETPMSGSGTGTGNIDISAPTIADSIATYNLTLSLPVSFDQVVYDEPGVTVRAQGEGTFQAVGTFSRTLAPAWPTWNISAGGSWANPTHWSTNSIPNAPGAKAYLTDKATAPATVTLDGNTTVGEVYFRNLNAYTVASGSAGSFILDNNGNGALIQVDSGSHVIAAPLRLADHTQIETNTSSALDITAGITAEPGKGLTKKGPGALRVRSGLFLSSAATLDVKQGVLQADYIVAGTLRIAADALVALPTEPGTPTLSVFQALEIAGSTDAWEGTLDLGRGRLVIQADAQTGPTYLAQVSNQIKSGRADHWRGKGITSSAAREDAKHLTGLAVIVNNDGHGRPIIPTSGVPDNLNAIFVMYTWNGDVNLDGAIDAADYFRVDSGYITQAGGYQNGDLNLDGVVDAADYFLIDSAYIGQTNTLFAASLAAIPEPAALSLLTLASLPLLARRQRR